jgi:hypothetical protein
LQLRKTKLLRIAEQGGPTQRALLHTNSLSRSHFQAS